MMLVDDNRLEDVAIRSNRLRNMVEFQNNRSIGGAAVAKFRTQCPWPVSGRAGDCILKLNACRVGETTMLANGPHGL